MSDIAAEPGDTVHVQPDAEQDTETENINTGDGDVNETDVNVDDDSYTNNTDDSVNVNVNVEAPEAPEPENHEAEMLSLLREISNKLDRNHAVNQTETAPEVTVNNEPETETAPEPEVVAPEGETEPTDVKDVPPEDEKPKRRHRFGR